MAVTVAIAFDLLSADHAGEIALYAADDGETPTGDFRAYFGITGPDGVEHKAFPSDPDFTFADDGNNMMYFDIPRDSKGNYLRGDYIIRVKISDVGDPDADPDPIASTTYLDNTSTYSFQPHSGGSSNVTVTLTTSYDCDTGSIEATGEYTNDVDDFVVDAESISVTPETATGEAAVSEAAGAISFAFGYTNANYTVAYEAEYTIAEVQDDPQITLYVIDSATVSETLNIQCTLPDLCKVASCLEKEFKSLEAKACGNGWESLTEKEKGKFGKASAIARLILMYKACGNDTKYREYVTEFEELMDCSCGCGEDTSDGPQAWTAPNPS